MDGLLVVVTGPSGSGKDTLIQRLLKVYPRMDQIVTYTTRPARPNETEGVEHHFITIQDYNLMKQRGDFIETVEKYSNQDGLPYGYGTAKIDIVKSLEGGGSFWTLDLTTVPFVKDIILKSFSPQQVQSIIDRTLIIGVYVAKEIAEERLKLRGDNVEEKLIRLQTDWVDWEKAKGSMDVIIENREDRMDEVVGQLIKEIDQFKDRIEK